MNQLDQVFLMKSINVAQSARRNGNHPFGAILVGKSGEVLLSAENTVETSRDCTGHAEMNLVRKASEEFTPDQLKEMTLYSSTEPCAMCAGAIYWSNIRRIVFALGEDELYKIIGKSTDQLTASIRNILSYTSRNITIEGPFEELASEAKEVHMGFWNATTSRSHKNAD